nr:PREDICTED: U6 snRNA-associated Sm-like protein LSm5 isoform X2 [Rhinolophus sinicus]
MGSVSSALARSRNTVVQLDSSPPQPEVPPAAPAARRDRFAFSKIRKLGRGSGETPTPPAAWEARPAAGSLEGRAKLASPELSAVLKRAGSVSQPDLPRSRSAMDQETRNVTHLRGPSSEKKASVLEEKVNLSLEIYVLLYLPILNLVL